jgi:hypothetical protein
MTRSLWLPFVIGLILLLIGIPIVSLLPRNPSLTEDIPAHEEEPLLPDNSEPGDRGKMRKGRSGFINNIKALRNQFSGRFNFQLLLSIFFVAAMASSNSPLFPQYISKRYDWTFANAGYLLSIKAAVNITLLALIVPSAVKVLSSHHDFESGRINKLGAQLMLAISVAGVLFIAVSPSVPYLVFCV